MNFYARRFNLYLVLLLALPWVGCALFDKKKTPEKAGAIRLHIESPVTLPEKTITVTLLRSSPVVVTVESEPLLTEASLLAAALVETPGGFAVRVKFDETAGWMLEQATARNPGKHLVIFGQWGETKAQGRFLAAPVINRRIGDATVTFTPDASREEAQQMVDGLNNLAKIMHTPQKK